MNDKRTQDLLDDLSWIMDADTYGRYLAEYDRLMKLNSVGECSGPREEVR